MPPLGGPAGGIVETTVVGAVEWVRLGVEVTGAVVIALGVLGTVIGFAITVSRRRMSAFTAERLRLARYLALALELQLAADILSTAVAPSWEQIGKLGAIAVIRTALNFFLMRELQETGEVVEGAPRGAALER